MKREPLLAVGGLEVGPIPWLFIIGTVVMVYNLVQREAFDSGVVEGLRRCGKATN